MAAGYSGTALVKKLGLKPGMTMRIINEPEHYRKLLGTIPADVQIKASTRGTIDFIHLFTETHAALGKALPGAVRALAADGLLWVSWPKKSSPLHKDLSETEIRQAGLDAGLVDVKICAVDADWSGLKFVYRLKDRPAAANRRTAK